MTKKAIILCQRHEAVLQLKLHTAFDSYLFRLDPNTEIWSYAKVKIKCINVSNARVELNILLHTNSCSPCRIIIHLTPKSDMKIILEYHTHAFYLKFLNGLVHKWLMDQTFLWSHQNAPKLDQITGFENLPMENLGEKSEYFPTPNQP